MLIPAHRRIISYTTKISASAGFGGTAMNILNNPLTRFAAKCGNLILSIVILSAFWMTSTAQAAITWTPMNGPGGGDITSFEFVSNTEIWASSNEGLVYKTTDGGTSWSKVSTLVGTHLSNNTLKLMVDSTGKYYAHLGDRLDLYSSTDNGASWTSVATDVGAFHLDSNDVLYITQVVVGPSFQYVSQVSSSADGGASWTTLGDVVTPANAPASQIAMDGAGNLYVLQTGFGDGVYRSTDGGASWTSISELTSFPAALAADEQGNLYAYASGLYVSNDNGANWTKKTVVTDAIDHFAVSGNGEVYAAQGGPLNGNTRYWRTSDGGASWTSTNLPQADTQVNRVGVAPNGDLYLNFKPRVTGLVGNTPNPGGGRVMKLAAAGGSSYIDLNSGLGHASITYLLESGGNLLAAASYGNLWLSTDAGASWSVPASAPATGIFGLGQHGGTLYLMSASGIYSSPDNGANWTQINTSETAYYSEFTSDGNGRLYVYGEGASGESGIKYSDDGGLTWTAFNTGLTDCRGSVLEYENALAVSADGQNIYAGSCYSNDAGSTWAKSAFPSGSTQVIHSLILDSSGKVLAGKNIGGIEKSIDNGANYDATDVSMELNNGVGGIAGISTLFRDSNGTYYALAPSGVGAYLSGVWSSTDGGTNWLRDNGGLPVIPRWGEYGALTMAETPSGTLILSTAGSGLFAATTGTGGAPNVPPVANAGSDQTVTAGDTVTLDGSASSDSDGTITGYLWSETGSAVTITNNTSATASFVAPAVTATTTYTISLTVTDDDLATDTDQITITVNPAGSGGGTGGTGGSGGGSTGSSGGGGGGAFGLPGLLALSLVALGLRIRSRNKAGLKAARTSGIVPTKSTQEGVMFRITSALLLGLGLAQPVNAATIDFRFEIDPAAFGFADLNDGDTLDISFLDSTDLYNVSVTDIYSWKFNLAAGETGTSYLDSPDTTIVGDIGQYFSYDGSEMTLEFLSWLDADFWGDSISSTDELGNASEIATNTQLTNIIAGYYNTSLGVHQGAVATPPSQGSVLLTGVQTGSGLSGPSGNSNPVAVPEPSIIMLMIAGLAGLGIIRGKTEYRDTIVA